jgi:type IV secretory pathway TraG/TraD family ATPase VirD4
MTMFDHKIIVCDFPLLEYGHETGRLISVMLKLIFQRAWLRRDLEESGNPVALWMDEFQYFVTRWDNFFQETCRGFRVIVVALTQNILAISESLGETQPGSKTRSLLGNLATKIFLQQNETETAAYAADQIGKEYRYIENFNAGGGREQGQSHSSVGGSRQLAHLVEPIEFSRLEKPSSDNPLAQAIVYQSGRTFNATKTERNPKGRNFLSVFFSRN